MLFGVAAAIVLVIVAVVAWYLIEAHPLGGPGKRVVVEVTQGEGTSEVASALEQRGVVGSALALRLSFLLHGSPTIDPGGYVFHTNQSFSTVRSILSHGPDLYEVNVQPGYTVAEVTQAVHNRTFDELPAVTGLAFQFAKLSRRHLWIALVVERFRMALASNLTRRAQEKHDRAGQGGPYAAKYGQDVDRFVR